MVGTLHGAAVLYPSTVTVNVFLPGLFPEMIINIEGLRVIGEAFVYPHVGQVVGGDVITEPFMSRFVNHDEIPFFAPSAAGTVASEVSVLEFIAIGNGTLMLHT